MECTAIQLLALAVEARLEKSVLRWEMEVGPRFAFGQHLHGASELENAPMIRGSFLCPKVPLE